MCEMKRHRTDLDPGDMIMGQGHCVTHNTHPCIIDSNRVKHHRNPSSDKNIGHFGM